MERIREQLAENGIEVTLEEAEQLHDLACRMKKLSQLSQWKLEKLTQEVSERRPEMANKMKSAFNAILEMK